MKTLQDNTRLLILQCISLILSGCTIYGYAPVGIGFFCAMYSIGNIRVITVITTLVGMAYALVYTDLVKYAMVIVAYMAIEGIIGIYKKEISIYINAVLIAFTMAALEFTGLYTERVTDNNIAAVLGVCVLCGAVTVVFRRGIDGILNGSVYRQIQNEEIIGIASITGIIIYYFISSYNIPYSILETAIFFLLLFSAYKYGAGMGAIFGASLGIVLGADMGQINVVSIMCVLAIIVGGLGELGRVATVIALICAYITGGMIFAPDIINEANIQGVITASIIFLILPGSVVYRRVEYEDKNKFMEKSSAAFGDKLDKLSSSIEVMCSTINDNLSDENNENSDRNIIRTAVENVCVDCTKKDECRYKNHMMLRMLNNDNMVNADSICTNTALMELEIKHLRQSKRSDQIWNGRISSIKDNIGYQLREISQVIGQYTDNSQHMEENRKFRKLLQKRLRNKGVSICEMRQGENETGAVEIELTVKCDNRKTITSREISSIISDITGYNIVSDGDNRVVVDDEYRTLIFRQAENFEIEYAVAKSVKNGGKISGDNHSVVDIGNGKWMFTLADGMGSGADAFKESESVLEFIEKMVSTGFNKKSALSLINSIKSMDWNNEKTTSVDMGVVNMYSGICNFVKMGAASTFIRRDKWVDVIRSTSLPLGIVNETDVDSATKKLYEGDIVVMMSDGVLDGIHGENKELEVSRMLLEYEDDNPKSLADRILDKAMEDSYYTPADDMTVVVASISENRKYA